MINPSKANQMNKFPYNNFRSYMRKTETRKWIE